MPVLGSPLAGPVGYAEAVSGEEQSLFDHARNALPRWLTRGKSAKLEWLWSAAALFTEVYNQATTWLSITYILEATGAALNQHAKDRGTVRRSGESDAALQQRLITVTDVVTEPILKSNINAVLTANGLGSCAFVNLRRDRGHYHTTGNSYAFASRGYRMTNASRPMEYIVILPYGTSAAIANGIREYLRQYGPGGYGHIVEVRANP